MKKVSVYHNIQLPFGRQLSVLVVTKGNPANRRAKGVHFNHDFGYEITLATATMHMTLEINDAPQQRRIANARYLRLEQRLGAVLPGLRLARHPGTEAIAGFGCVPVQIEGSAEGIKEFYFRFRGNCASIRTQPSSASANKPQNGGMDGFYPTDKDPDAIYAGDFNTDDDLVECFARCVEALADTDPVHNPDHIMRMNAHVNVVLDVLREKRTS